MELFNKTWLLTLALPIAACIDFAGEKETLTPLPFMVTAQGTAFYGKDGIHAPGPINRLCVGLTSEATVTPGSSAAHARVVVPWRRNSAELTATLIDSDSVRVLLGFAGTRKTTNGQLACFENQLSRETNRRYYRGELASDDSILIEGIQWASGKNVESLRAPANTR